MVIVHFMGRIETPKSDVFMCEAVIGVNLSHSCGGNSEGLRDPVIIFLWLGKLFPMKPAELTAGPNARRHRE